MIRAEVMTVRSEIHKLINFVWNKEKLSQQYGEPIIILIYKKCDKTDCSNYRGVSLLSTVYGPFSNVVLLRLAPYVQRITGDHQCTFRCNR